MSATQLNVGEWQREHDGSWKLVSRIPPEARLHVPCEDGRIVTGRVPVAPWGGLMRASCVVVELDGLSYQLSVRSRAKNFLHADVRCDGNDITLTLTYRLASYLVGEKADAAPDTVLSKHADPASVWRDYRRWMELAWPASPFFSPPWTRDIPAVVLLEMWTGNGTITHDFDDMVRLLQAMHDTDVPAGTLLYFWGFHAPFDTRYPDYWPARELGGERGLCEAVEAAGRLGYRLMPHLNYWGCDRSQSVFQRFSGEQVRDRHGVLQGWRMSGEPSIEYIRPSCVAWREFIAETCGRFVSRFPVDALFLDQLGFFIDDPGCDFDTATQHYIDAVQAACPGVALCGEIFHERCRSLPLWQVWGTPWCGLPVREDFEQSTMWRDLFGGELTFLPHMGMPGAVPMRDSWPAYYWYIDRHGPAEATNRANRWHRQVGAVPSVRVNFREHGFDEVALAILTD